jgi:hypothetical protein
VVAKSTHRWLGLSSVLAVAALTLADVACMQAEPEPADALSLRAGTGGKPVTLRSGSRGGVWINNGLEDPDVSGIDPAFALSSAQGLADDHGLVLDPELRDVVRYVVECALPLGHEITKQVGGQSLVFEGALGLAPEWEDDECDEDCQEWVSACLLARTNVSGQSVTVWMRADHPAIGDGTSLLHPAYEASFFGNLFADPESQHMCKGPLVGPLLAQLEGRTCSAVLGEPCGFVEYTDCPVQPRCAYPLLGGLGLTGSPVGCIAGDVDTGASLHTISTYVGLL